MSYLPKTALTFLTIQEAAEQLNVSIETLRRWDARGILVPIRTPGKQRRYTLEQIQQFKFKNANPQAKLKQVTIQEASEILGVSIETLRRWDERGLLVPIRTPGNQRRYTLRQLEHFKKAQDAGQLPVLPIAPVMPQPEVVKRVQEIPKADLFAPIVREVAPQDQPTKELSPDKIQLEANKRYQYIAEDKKSDQKRSFFSRARANNSSIYAASFAFVFVLLFAGILSLLPLGRLPLFKSFVQKPSVLGGNLKDVLAADAAYTDFKLSVNIPAIFLKSANFKEGLTAEKIATLSGGLITNNEDGDFGTGSVFASNILYGVEPGVGIAISSGQTPTITNTGVTSLGGSNGALSLAAGSGISISGLTISSTVTAPSASNSFANMAVSGQSTLSAGSPTDTLTFVAGSNVTLTTDTGNKSLTITAAGGTPSQWTTTGTDIYYNLGNVGIGNTAPTEALDVTGNIAATGSFISNGSTGITIGAPTCVTAVGGIVTGTGSCGGSGGGSNWMEVNGALSPIIPSVDVLIGSSATTSAKFGFINVSSGTPTATISGNIVLNSAGSLQTTKAQNLTIGGSTTGQIVLSGRNGNATGITLSGYGVGVLQSNASGVLSSSALNLAGGATLVSGLLPIANGGTNGSATPTAGAIAYGTGTAYAFSGVGNTNQCLISGGAGTPTWADCTLGGGTNYWNSTNGTLYPINSTLDLLIGGTSTASAKFAVLNMNSGTPVASLSATTTGLALSAAGSIQSLRNGSLTIGGNTTGQVILSGNSGGATGVTLAGYGVGVIQSNASGVLSSSALNLAGGATLVSGLLPIANGGTNGSATPTNGGIAYGTGTAYAFSLAGTAGQILQSNGAGTPTWISPGGTLNFWQRNLGALSPLNISDDLLLGGTATSSALIKLGGTANATSFFNTGGNVGIGTTSPINKLDVSGGLAVGSYAGVNSAGSNSLIVSGNVGFGTTDTSTYKLNITGGDIFYSGSDGGQFRLNGVGDVDSTLQNFFGNTALSQNAGAKNVGGSGWTRFTSNPATQINLTTGGIYLNWVATGTAGAIFDWNTGLFVQNGGNVGIGTTTPLAVLDVNGIASISGDLNLAGSSRSIQATANNTLTIGGNTTGNIAFSDLATFNAGATVPSGQSLTLAGITGNNQVLYGTAATGVVAGATATSTSNLCLLSGASAPAWGACPGGTGSNWTVVNGIITPNSSTLDLTLGGQSTSSAKFAVLNMNSGTPVASVSATTGTQNGIAIAGDGSIQSLRMGTLTLGGSTTGNIEFKPGAAATATMALLGSGNVGIGTTTPVGLLNVSGRVTGRALATFNETGDQAIFTASASGTTRFVIQNNGNVGIGTSSPIGALDVARDADTNLVLSSYGTGVNPNIVARAARGTQLAPTASLANDELLNIGARGYGATAFGSNNKAAIFMNASQDWTATAQGAYMTFATTPNDSISRAERVRIDNAGNVGIGTTSPLGLLNVNGRATGKALAIFNETGNQDIFTASSSGITRFTIANNGTITASAYGAGVAQFSSTGVLSSSALNLAGGATLISGVLPIANGGTNGSATPTAGAIAYGTGTAYAFSGVGTANQCLVSGAAGTPTWADCALGASTNYWNSANGTLYPINSTLDLLVGGQSTTSAKFAVLNMNTGTPVASVSSGLNGTAAYLTADGSLQTAKRGTLNLGGSSTGNIQLAPNGTTTMTLSNGNVGIGTTTMASKFAVAGNATIGSSYTTVAAPSNGMLIEGRLGIGTTVPDTTLHVLGSGTFERAAAAQDTEIAFHNEAGQQKWSIHFDGGSPEDLFVYGAASSQDLILQTDESGSVLGNVGIGTNNPRAKLDVIGNLSVSGTATASALAVGYSSIGAGTGNAIFSGSVGIGTSTIGDALEVVGSIDASVGYKVGNVAGTTTANMSCVNVTGGIVTAAGTCTAVDGSKWDQNLGALYPKNSTVDLLLGGTATTAAKFAVLNINSGTPTASVSATAVANRPGLYMSGTGSLSSVNKGTLTLGGTDTGNIIIDAGSNAITLSDATTASSTFTAAGLITANAGLTVASGQNLTLAGITGNNQVLYGTTATGVVAGATATSTAGQCLISGATTPSWGLCDLGSGIWNQANGSIYPANSTVDLLVGGQATTSAKFAVLGMNTGGTPVASLSATTTGLALNSGGSIQSLRNGSLTIGGSTTGQVILSGNSGGATGITLAGYGAGVIQSNASGVLSSSALNLAGGATLVSGLLPIANGGTNGSATPTAGAIAYGTGTAYAFSAVGSANQCLVSGAAGAPSWADCALGASTNYWNSANGTLYPINSTLDLLVGGQSTASAKFAVLNINSGTPTASVSATGVANRPGVSLGGDGTIQSLNKGRLTIGGATTGAIQFTPNNTATMTLVGGLVGIGTTVPTAGYSLDVAGNVIVSGTNPKLTIGDGGTEDDVLVFDGNGLDYYLGYDQTDALLKSGIGGVAGTGTITQMNLGGNFGIGTATPLAQLHVSRQLGDFAATGKSLVIFNQTENQDIFTASASGTTRFVIQNDGTVGIGTATPGANGIANTSLELLEGEFAGMSMIATDPASDVIAYVQARGTGGIERMQIGTLSNHNIAFLTNDTVKMTLKNDGNLGIGVSNPGAQFEVLGNGTGTMKVGSIGAANFTGLSVNGTLGASYNLAGGTGTSTLFINRPTGGDMQFLENDSSLHMIIKSGGNIGIGTNVPSMKLDIQDSQSATAAAQIYNTNTGTDADGLVIKLGNTATSTSTTNHFISFEQAGIGIVGSIQGNGAKTIAFKNQGVADFAEYIKKDSSEEINYGDVVCAKENDTVTKCASGSRNIIGVMSDTFTVIGGDENGTIPVGINGLIYTKVSTQNGIIKAGDYVTASDIPGVAIKATHPSQVLGKAIEDYTESGVKRVKILVAASWYDPDVYLTTTGDISIFENPNDPTGSTYTVKRGNETISRKGVFSDVVSGVLKAGVVYGDKIMVGDQNILDIISAAVGSGSVHTENGDSASEAAQLTTQYADMSDKITQMTGKVATLEQLTAQTASETAFLRDILEHSVLGVASGSGSVSQAIETLDVTGDGTIGHDLSVLGRTTVNDLGVTGSLTAGVLTLNGLDGEINSVGEPLKIQSLAAAPVEIMHGKVVIKTNGEVSIKGTVTAKKLNIDESEEDNKAVGQVIIKENETSVEVVTHALTDKSRIFATPDEPVAIGSKATGEATFRITLDKPAERDIAVSWWVVN